MSLDGLTVLRSADASVIASPASRAHRRSRPVQSVSLVVSDDPRSVASLSPFPGVFPFGSTCCFSISPFKANGVECSFRAGVEHHSGVKG